MPGGIDRVRWLNHAAVALLALVAWFGGGWAGYRTAATDMSATTSELPLISRMEPKGLVPSHVPTSPAEGYRLLLQTSEGIRFFKAVEHPATESPLVHYVPMGDIDALTTCPRC